MKTRKRLRSEAAAERRARSAAQFQEFWIEDSEHVRWLLEMAPESFEPGYRRRYLASVAHDALPALRATGNVRQSNEPGTGRV